MEKILTNKWFWIGLVLLLIFSIIFDTVVLSSVLIKNLVTKEWPPALLLLTFSSAVLGAIATQKKSPANKQLADIGKVLFIVVLLWVFFKYGILEMFLFMTTIFVATRLFKLFVPKNTGNRRV